jgi:hypothetical protein
LSLFGDPGVARWARVLEDGLHVFDETGANIAVASLSRFGAMHRRACSSWNASGDF